MSNSPADQPTNFIRQIIDQDLADGKNEGQVITRFPPEPNGYLHIGHAKSISLNFGIARDYQGLCYLRFDDTNPDKESQEFIDAIQADIEWLGFEWSKLAFASDYFEQLYEFALQLIKAGKAFVCSLDSNEIRSQRGTLTEPGLESPYRNRSVEENLDLFHRMRAGAFKEGEHVLRAKIDMASPNINLRDPVLYRIKHTTHPRTQDQWCIYPMYDYTHCISDALEAITHSLCTLEFEDHRPLYDWVLDELETPCHPQQIEFARLALDYTITSKRKLHLLVQEGHVDGWDDPRMPTLSGMRRRGIPPQAIRDFCDRIGITKKDALIEMSVLENCIRENLDPQAARIMCVLKPLKVVIENYPEDDEEILEVSNHPKDPDRGRRPVPFSNTLYIERDDFLENPPGKFFRLAPGKEVRLRYAYNITCTDIIKDDSGVITELRCRYDPDSKGTAGRKKKVKGVIHWVSAKHALDAQVRLYDRLFNLPNPGSSPDLAASLNPDSLEVLHDCKIEPAAEALAEDDRVQFETPGYFSLDLR
ncbi:MAG: glutamine--tRNA ligase/YqeY domain fusion protein, partial [Gammaproteobacteria bacterium]|nr:glutamine--tRNA ligase/YqeY domain fusion protein [Gammaproteobacteria bacterium]